MQGGEDISYRRFRVGGVGSGAEAGEDDIAALADLLAAAPEVVASGDDLSPQAQREMLTYPGHDPARDRWVATPRSQPDRLISVGALFKAPTTPRADLLVVTHPDWRRRGIGGELLRRAVAGARALGATDCAANLTDGDAATARFLTARGFTLAGGFTELTAPGDHAFPAPQWPAGFSIRPWRDVGDLATLVEASNTCYAGLWGHNVTTEEEWRHWLPTLDTAGVFFLSGPDGALVGTARAARDAADPDDEGHPATPALTLPLATAAQTEGGGATWRIDAPGVVEPLRNAGLYRALLLHALAWLAPMRPARYVIESWGDAPATLAEYAALGFSVARRQPSYRLPLVTLS